MRGWDPPVAASIDLRAQTLKDETLNYDLHNWCMMHCTLNTVVVLEYVNSKKPWKNESYDQTSHQEITERLASPTTAPLRWVSSSIVAYYSPLMPLFHESYVLFAIDVLCIWPADLTTPTLQQNARTDLQITVEI